MGCFYIDRTEEDVRCDICREPAEKEVIYRDKIYYCCSCKVCMKRLKLKVAKAAIKKRGQ